MQGSWFRSFKQMDEDQKSFIRLPAKGRYSLVGPPGSGKTNLLLVRAEVFAGSGEKNVLIITYTRTLAEFIRSGIKMPEHFQQSQIKTFHSWALAHIRDTLGYSPIDKEDDFDENNRLKILEALVEANERLGTKKIYSGIFVDEAQDLTAGELEALLSLSDNVCICGDERQGIYQRDGLSVADKLGLNQHRLDRHFRIGHKIARVADRLQPPDDGTKSLENSSNYDMKLYGESSAKLHPKESRDAQFTRMVELLRIQLDAYTGDSIGIFCGRTETLHELRARFNETDLSDTVSVYGVDSDARFTNGKRIHVMTLHSSKGTEFRAVHMFGIEELATPGLQRTRLSYTGVTRAKTSLNAYRSADTTVKLEHAFAEPAAFTLEDLLPDTD
ncbi:UvrD-helicase domain-containing protein [Cupriavidus respiraculi]|uniref:DNA 3'-5' helicase II n=1 Tax=Cupriavidus respiraculi TaxID=195930 RepID=A0ABN7YHT5_9BURK|nr:UvrD-helicase domain-containing protein [Cupriavidus respiraculi]CAG9171637.1 ATP-dependent DNA helicase Rep [Cupriavidus respiraculi]